MSVESYVIYNQVTGHINRTVVCSAKQLSVQVGPGEGYLPGTIDDDLHYVNQGQITRRPVLPVTTTRHTLYGVPEGTVIEIDDQQYTADGQAVELEFSLPGTYQVRLNKWPYLEWGITLEN